MTRGRRLHVRPISQQSPRAAADTDQSRVLRGELPCAAPRPSPPRTYERPPARIRDSRPLPESGSNDRSRRGSYPSLRPCPPPPPLPKNQDLSQRAPQRDNQALPLVQGHHGTPRDEV
ncbi:hypothetical protein EMIHUDRAFT_433095, partial [Emiliania huxleyi CCMP1516]|uniref:Uncharacterized protein n=2 Tax=Emiliania huxleyi TaxID=2903 RepID=A0A0D3I7W7_EMIH1